MDEEQQQQQREPTAGPSSNGKMTLAECLAMKENEGANLVVPKRWCPHLQTANLDAFSGDVDVAAARCHDCQHLGENWICLVCFSVRCSRYVKEHMLKHGTETGHALALSFSDISVWCYVCDDYVDNESLHPFKNAVHLSKFGRNMPKRSDLDLDVAR